MICKDTIAGQHLLTDGAFLFMDGYFKMVLEPERNDVYE